MTRWSDFQVPRTVEAAVEVLSKTPDSAIIAGGTDLLLDIEQDRHPPVSSLIDISRIEELHKLAIQDGYLEVGSAIPLSKLLKNELLQEHAPGLIDACKLIGGPQVRNVATLGGNVAHALPAGDGTIALLSLGAEAQLASDQAREWVALPDLFKGPGEVTFDRRRVMISTLRFKLRNPLEGSAFRRVMRPQGVAIAIMNIGVWMRCDPTGKILDSRIAVGPAGPTPFLAHKASQVLIGSVPESEVLDRAEEAIRSEARFRTSRHRASKSYREHLVSALLHETVTAAYERALAYGSV